MKHSLSLIFTGDIGFTRHMKDSWQDKELIEKEILTFCKTGDHVIANVEGAVVDPEKTALSSDRGVFFHYMHARAAEVFNRIGADFWCLANNHAMDLGSVGLESTLSVAKDRNAIPFGAGRNLEEASAPVYLDGAGGVGMIAVGFVSECPGATENEGGVFTYREMELIGKRISEIKKRCRWCIVVSHDGEEFTSLPHPYIRNRYRTYLEMGADLVVAHHPHVPMGYEFFGEKAIFYSLGNFIFDTDYQRAQMNTERGVLLKLNLTPNFFTFDAVGTEIDREEKKIKKASLPDIFTEIGEDEYALLLPLSAKAFVASEKKRNLFLDPERFESFTEADWEAFLLSPNREEYIKGETMDFAEILPLANFAEEGKWKESRLEKVIEYIRKQI